MLSMLGYRGGEDTTQAVCSQLAGQVTVNKHEVDQGGDKGGQLGDQAPPFLPTPSLASLWRRVAACLPQLLGVKREELEEHTRQHRGSAPCSSTASLAILRSVNIKLLAGHLNSLKWKNIL